MPLQSFRCHAILVKTRSDNKCCVSTCLSHFICHFYGVPCSCMRNKENEYREALGRFRGFLDKGHLGEKKQMG